jgi:hypothetical protein
MTTDVLCRHFSRMGARLKIKEPNSGQRVNVRIDVDRDRHGEFFDIRCKEGLVPEILDVQPEFRHLLLMVRDGEAKNKYLLGHDERHWFAAAVPGDAVRNVRTAIASLRPPEAVGDNVIRQGEWFFVPVLDFNPAPYMINRNEPLSRGSGSKPHMCEELARESGTVVMVNSEFSTGVTIPEYERLLAQPKYQRMNWRRMVRDADVFARGKVRHSDHKTVYLDGWHRVYMNRERFARHAVQIAFLD